MKSKVVLERAYDTWRGLVSEGKEVTGVLVENEEGLAVHVTTDEIMWFGSVKKNPYSVTKTRKGRACRSDAELLQDLRQNVRRRTSPPSKGFVWRMGYRGATANYTQGELFPDMSGSSLNRKSFEKKLLTTAGHIIALVSEIEKKCDRFGIRILVGADEGGGNIHVCHLVQQVQSLIDKEDIEGARKSALRFSVALREYTRSISFGVHVLSARSRGKIRDKATAFFRSCPGDRVFCTLTFIAPVDDKTGVVILNKFLTQLRKKYPTVQYFWVAERQTGDRNEGRGVQKDATGNIHFHMILNKRLTARRFNALWVLQQYNSGLRGHDEGGRQIPMEKVLWLYSMDKADGFKNKKNPVGIQNVLNPFDVKKVTSIGRLSSYLTKYITKQPSENNFFQCQPWHCSRRVSRLFTRQTVSPSTFRYMKSPANYGVDKSTGEVWGVPVEKWVRQGVALYIPALNKAAPLAKMRYLEQVNKWILNGQEIDRLRMFDDDSYKKIWL